MSFGIQRGNRRGRQLRRLRDNPYTGFGNQMQQTQQRQQQRGGNRRPQPTGRVSTTQQEGESQGLLAQAKQGKEYVDGITGLYDQGVKANEGIGKGMDWVKDKTGFSMPDLDFSVPDFLTGGSSTPATATPIPTNFSMVDGKTTSLLGDVVGQNSSYASPVASGMADPASGLLGDSTGAIDGMDELAGMQNANPLGAATSALGLGLNINDMVSGGVNFGNMTGALGSGILGASALGIGAANAWNPVGWGLLAASAADSIFDIF